MTCDYVVSIRFVWDVVYFGNKLPDAGYFGEKFNAKFILDKAYYRTR